MLNREQIIKMYNSRKLHDTQAIIIGSAAMVLRGVIVEASNLDVAVRSDVFWTNHALHNTTISQNSNSRQALNIHEFDFLDHTAIDGIPVATPRQLITLYQANKRIEDRDKIRILQEDVATEHDQWCRELRRIWRARAL